MMLLLLPGLQQKPGPGLKPLLQQASDNFPTHFVLCKLGGAAGVLVSS